LKIAEQRSEHWNTARQRKSFYHDLATQGKSARGQGSRKFRNGALLELFDDQQRPDMGDEL
jgi:hypothetical protein